MKPFEVGAVYYGTLACAHGDFPVRCIRKTEKSVWFEHVTSPQFYAAGRVKLHRHERDEAAIWRGWYISSTKQTGGDFDPYTI